MNIPFMRLNLNADEYIEDIKKILNSGQITRSRFRIAFESKLKEIYGTDVITYTSGSTALLAALSVLPEKGEVLIPTITYAADSNSAKIAGFDVKFVDVDPITLQISFDDLKKKTTNKTKAVILVHYSGITNCLDKIVAFAKEKNIFIIEDSSHAFASRSNNKLLGTYGDVGILSFHPTKQITTSEGGACIVNNKILLSKIIEFRNNGLCFDADPKKPWKYSLNQEGMNFNLNEISSLIGLKQLAHLNQYQKQRKLIAEKYFEGLKNIKGIRPLAYDLECNSLVMFVVLVTQDCPVNRDKLFLALKDKGIGANVHYAPLHMMPMFKNEKHYCPVAEKLFNQILSLPIYPDLKIDEVEYIVGTIEGIINEST